MSMNRTAIEKQLDQAAQDVQAMPQLNLHEQIDERAAYELQHRVVEQRIARGNPIVGMKLGFTNPVKAAQMGVFDVIAGSLTADMRIEDGGELNLNELIHGRVEPELAFLLKRDIDLSGPSEIPFSEAVAAVAPALEVIDSRYENFSFSLHDVIADNTSASKFVLGPWIPFNAALDARDIANRAVVLELDGQVAETGSTAAILGDPVRAYEACCRLGREFGFTLPAGAILLVGAATIALPVSGHTTATCRVTGLGAASIRITQEDL